MLEPMIRETVSRSGLYGPEHVREWLVNPLGSIKLWLAGTKERGPEAIAVVEVLQHPNDRVMQVHGCAGKETDRWIHHLKTLEASAKEQGCGRVRIEGRKGWARKLPDYKIVGIILEKKL